MCFKKGGWKVIKEYCADDADGQRVYYRLVTSCLEYQTSGNNHWMSVAGVTVGWWLLLTPAQLRAIADCLEGK